mmetsp:Transcript_106892/g.185710  ORF Transcript_106892/g.185710 Transcript_106892/m.185710 type:complete len:285 (+) Transcript_106892:96-950(+)
MNLRPSRTCCGCCSLLVGMEAICLFTLIGCITIMSICSSSSVVKISTIAVSPTVQVILGSWCFLGIPIAITAGVAALYRIEIPIRVFFFYILASFACNFVPLYMIFSGSICDSVISKEVQQLGSAFVCTFADSFVFCWLLIFAVTHAYVAYVVWSAAEEIAESPFPELMRYSGALKGVFMPNPAASAMPLNTRAVALNGAGPMMQSSFGMSEASPFGTSMRPPFGGMPMKVDSMNVGPPGPNGPPMGPVPGYGGMEGSMPYSEAGMQQSFFPSPSSGMFRSGMR